MSKVLVLYYSTYGHLETMAGAIAEGAREVAGTEVTVKRVPETVPADVAKGAHFKLDQAAPVATDTSAKLAYTAPRAEPTHCARTAAEPRAIITGATSPPIALTISPNQSASTATSRVTCRSPSSAA